MADKSNQELKLRHKRSSLKALYLYLYKAYRFTQIHSKLTISLFFCLMLAALFYAKTTKIAVRMEELSDPNLSSFKEMQALKEEYLFEDKFTLVIKNDQGFTQKDFCQIKNWLQKEVNTNPHIAGVSSIFQLRKIDFKDNSLFYPPLLDNPCEGTIDWPAIKDHQLLEMFSTKDFRDLIFHLTVNPYPLEDQEKLKSVYNYQELDEIVKRAKNELPFEIMPGGTLYFQKSVMEGIKHSEVVNYVAATLLFLGYYFLYRSIIGSIALLLVLFSVNLITKAGMGIMGHMIDPLTSCVFLILTVSAIEDYILLSFLVFKKKVKFNSAVKKLLVPSFLTSVTTSIGFGSLAFSTTPSLVHFSLWTALGAMLEWAAMFLLIPAVLNIFPRLKAIIQKHPIPKSFLPKEMISVTPSKKLSIFLALLPLILIFIFQKANLNYSPYDMFTSDHPISTFRSHILKTRATEGEVSIVFKDLNQDTKKLINEISKIKEISRVYSENELEEELHSIPDYLHSLIREDFKRTDIGRLFFTNNSKRAIAYISSYDTKDIPKIVSQINSICNKSCTVTSEIIVSKDYALGILQTLFDSSLSGFTSIILLICWLVYSARGAHYLPIISSTLWASFMLLIFVIVFQFKINVVTCVALSVLIGLAGDNAIQFLLLQKNSFQESITEVGEASSENFTLMMLLTSTLLFSYFRSPKIMAFLMVVGIIFMFIGDLWILNGLVNTKEKNETK